MCRGSLVAKRQTHKALNALVSADPRDDVRYLEIAGSIPAPLPEKHGRANGTKPAAARRYPAPQTVNFVEMPFNIQPLFS
jgi:hypothetical protein